IASWVDHLPRRTRSLLGGPIARSLPVSVRAKTRLRKAQRWLEGLREPSELRYLRWVVMFDEPARMSLYSDDWLYHLAEAGTAHTSEADPASILKNALRAAPNRDQITRATVADLLTYLPGDLLVKVDLASMAHSLECRAPFLDHRVVELAMAMPLKHKIRLRSGRSKVILKQAFADLLPPPIQTRAKMGFGVP